MEEFVIRRAARQDLKALMSLKQAYTLQTYKGFASTETLNNIPKDQWGQVFEAWLANPHIQLDVLWVREKLCAFSAYRLKEAQETPDLPEGEILALEVLMGTSPLYADALVTDTLAGLARMGVKRVRVWVLRDNFRSRFEYERYGFKADGETKEELFGGQLARWTRYVYRMP